MEKRSNDTVGLSLIPINLLFNATIYKNMIYSYAHFLEKGGRCCKGILGEELTLRLHACGFGFMLVFNATFNNISVISWRSVFNPHFVLIMKRQLKH